MADASHVQTDFRSGEWSPNAQGRMDDKEYHRGLNVCLNGYPIEAGAWTRRTGTRFCGYTRQGLPAWLQPFHFSQASPYVMEFTNSHLRFWSGTLPVFTNDPTQVVSVSTANPALLTLAAAVTWATGDEIMFLLSQGVNAPNAAPALNRRYTITKVSTTTFTLADALTGNAVVFGTAPFIANQVVAARVLDLATPYLANELTSIQTVTAEVLTNNLLQGQAINLHPLVAPQVAALTNTPGGSTFANFSYTAATFLDGPYFDFATTGNVTASNNTGSVTITAPANTFVSTDVGRQMRFFSQPPQWASGTAYVTGDKVTYQNVYYVAQSGSTGKQPDLNPTLWFVSPTAAKWAWGTITTVTDNAHAVVTLAFVPGDTQTATPLLYAGTNFPIYTWQMGLYSNTTGFPTNGVWHEGRLWLAGAQPNRFDSSVSNQPFTMSPTDYLGNVNDNNAIAYTLNSDDVNQINWMSPDHQGILMGTLGGEWLLSSGTSGDPLTPTNIKDNRVTRYKASTVPPVRAGLSLMFVQAQLKRLMEFTSDVFSGKFLGRNMSEKGRHLTGAGIRQMGYQQDISPNIWMNMFDGSLAGLCYKRESSFTSEPPTYYGWHRHTLGSGRVVESLAIGPNVDGSMESITLATNDPVTNIRHIEIMTDMFDETTPQPYAWFVDDGAAPAAALEDTIGNTVTLYGLNHLIGKTVSVEGGGLDLGDYVVAADGTIQLPLGGAAQSSTVGLGLPLFTDAFFNSFIGVPPGPNAVQTNRKVTVQYGSLVSQFITTYHDTGGAVTGTPNRDWMLNDFNRNEIWGFSTGSGATNGWTKYNRLTTAVKQDFTATSIFPSTIFQPSSKTVQGPAAIDDNGYIYWISDSSNNGCLRKMDPKTGTIIASFGTNASSFTNDNNFIEGSRNMVTQKVWQEQVNGIGVQPLPQGFRNFLLSCAATDGDFTVIQVDDIVSNNTTVITLPDGDTYLANTAQAFNKMQWTAFKGTVDEDLADCVAGATYTNGKLSFGDIWLVGHAKNAHLPGSTPLGFYQVRILANADQFVVPPGPTYAGNLSTGITKTKTGTLSPAQVDGTWTNFSSIYGLVFDKTTGNLILWVQTTDAVTNKQYVIAVNPLTAALVWKTPIAAGAFPPDSNWQTQFYCGYGTIAFFGTGTTMNSIATSSGALTTTSVPSSSALFGQFSDDRDAQTFYSDGSNIWHGLINVAGFSGQTSIITDYNLPVMPFAVGFTYNSDGQILRPIAQDVTGARNGPGFAKTKRNEKMGIQLARTQGISIGATFTKLRPLPLRSAGPNTSIINVTALFTGVTRESVEDDNTYDGMLCWRVSRPWPATVTAVGGFIHTQDI